MKKEPWIPQHDGKKRCKKCGGTGKWIYRWQDNMPRPYTCQECGGKGYK